MSTADETLEALAEKLHDMRQELRGEVEKWSEQTGCGMLENHARARLEIVEEIQDVLYGED